jgi:uncharacterized membrane protein (DUF106 family)
MQYIYQFWLSGLASKTYTISLYTRFIISRNYMITVPNHKNSWIFNYFLSDCAVCMICTNLNNTKIISIKHKLYDGTTIPIFT